jgi:hypothetical protein
MEESTKSGLQRVVNHWDPYNTRIRQEYYLNKNGNREGLYKSYHENGQLDCECYLQNGMLNGRYKAYNSSGDLTEDAEYNDNYRTGKCMRWYYDKNNKLDLTVESEFVKGNIEGREVRRYPNGDIHSITEYKNNSVVKVVELTDEKGRNCILPAGKLVVWKACKNGLRPVYVKIEVPEDAGRVTPRNTDRTFKSRISHGKVIDIIDKDGKQYDDARSFVHIGPSMMYERNKVAVPSRLDLSLDNECSAGINCQLYQDQCDYWF